MSIKAAQRHLLNLSNARRYSYPTRILHRLYSSDETPPNPPASPPQSPNPRPSPVQIQPVSYAVKPKPEPATLEEMRYMKDMPSSVSYDRKVVPLPEDRVAEEFVTGQGVSDNRPRVVRRAFRIDAQKEMEKLNEVPFPTLIQVEKGSNERVVVDLQDAIRRVKAQAKRDFDETLEAHVNLGIDRRRSDLMAPYLAQNQPRFEVATLRDMFNFRVVTLGVSGAVVLPHGTGKIVKVAVFAEGAAADEARAAGADVVGGDELIEEIKTSGKVNFDKCIATHSMMQRVTKIGKVLRGLTPNAKKGTVTNNVSGAVREAKQGLLDFRMKDAIVHVGLGKVSFTEEALQENVGAFVNALLLAKPVGLKKTSKYSGYVNSFHICSTMGPGFTVSIQSLSRAADSYSKLHPK